MKLIRTYPSKLGMTLRRFSEKLEFLCRLCQLVQESAYRVETPGGLICDPCYRATLQGKTITPYRDTENAPWNPERVEKKRLA